MNYAQRLEYEQHLHRKYFEPFDRLMEKKAQYYLNQVDKGTENKWLLEEIEVLEQFREYAVMMETLLQNAIDGQHTLGLQVAFWKSEYDRIEFWERCALQVFSQLQRLQGECQQQHSTK